MGYVAVCLCIFALMIQVFGVGIKLDRIIEILQDKNDEEIDNLEKR